MITHRKNNPIVKAIKDMKSKEIYLVVDFPATENNIFTKEETIEYIKRIADNEDWVDSSDYSSSRIHIYKLAENKEIIPKVEIVNQCNITF